MTLGHDVLALLLTEDVFPGSIPAGKDFSWKCIFSAGIWAGNTSVVAGVWKSQDGQVEVNPISTVNSNKTGDYKMNRRDFLAVVGGTGVASLASLHPAFAAGEQTTSLYLGGLIMVSFENPVLRIGFPKAPAHKATLKIVPVNGNARTIPVKGNGVLESKGGSVTPKIFAPEAVRMSEIYGTAVKARFEKCPSVIEIPYSAIKSVTTSKVTPDRWTFVRADNHQEIDTFRPRQIAEGLKLELLSNSVLKLDGGKTVVKLDSTQEMVANYSPDPKDMYPGQYADHFVHYMQYIDRPPAADFLVVPKKLTGAMSNARPKVGNPFMMYDYTPFCFVVVIGIAG
jgi:hypothetical protein